MNHTNSKSPFDDGMELVEELASEHKSEYYSPLPIVMILVLALFYSLGNIFIPSLIWHFGNDTVGMFFAGALATEIGLVSSSVAFARRSMLSAFTLNAFVMVLICTSYNVGLRTMDASFPIEVALFIYGVGFGAFVLTVGCLLVVRRLWKLRYTLQRDRNGDSEPKQKGGISIRYLMMTTAATAAAICIIRWSFPKSTMSTTSLELFQMAIMCGLEIVESLFVLLLCLQLVFLNGTVRRIVWSLVFLIAFCGLFPFLNAALVQFCTREIVYQYANLAYAYIVGLSLFLITTMLLLRLVGYRLDATARRVA